ncbi:MAG: glycosyltransferase family 87 protein [Pirellulaceae bacterium]|jgi:hypothetical protein|nr:glycosyltransferase family 87 protein [Pirellulaceae bacterium]
MSEFLFHYEPVPPTTWVYLSSLLMICVFFKFGRFWSVRNLDLVLLVLLSPGLLLVHYGIQSQQEQQLAQLSEAAEREFTNDANVRGDAPSGDASDGTNDLRPQSLNEGDRSEAVVTPPPSEPASDATTTVGEIGGGDTLTEAEQPSIEFAKNVQAVVESVDTEGETTDTNASSKGLDKQYYGFVWLLTVGGLFVIRLLIDPTMVRRPLLEPNLSTGGLAFMGVSLFVFLMANVVSSQPNEADLAGPKSAEHLLVGTPDDPDSKDPLRLQGPGNAIFHLIPTLVTNPSLFTEGGEPTEMGYVRTAKAMAILSHLAIVIGLVVIGYRHFGNIKTGIGAATLYLMLPYTALETGRVLHVLPAALLIWMVLCYRKPLWAGIFTGLAIGVVYYPLFLLPLWISFYWKRGLLRFGLGVTCTLFVVALSLALVSADFGDYLGNLRRLFGIWEPAMRHMQGVWGLGWDPLYRLPVMAAFVVMSVALALWPPQKNLGTLLSCSAAVMVASQFWHGYGGGLYIAWYLPLTLLTFLRPNLEDRVALTVLGEGWRPRLRRDLLARAAVWILP